MSCSSTSSPALEQWTVHLNFPGFELCLSLEFPSFSSTAEITDLSTMMKTNN